jgi:rhodanese-related sulfurtransferase
MARWIYQTLALLAISAGIAFAMFLVVGPPDRSVPCVQAELKADHVCLSTVLGDWGGDVFWVDARSKAEFGKGHLDGAILIPESDADNQIAVPEHMQQIGMAGVNGQKLVVYCATDACGSSELVAKKIRDTGFHSEVYVLQGGWKAVLASKHEIAVVSSE